MRTVLFSTLVTLVFLFGSRALAQSDFCSGAISVGCNTVSTGNTSAFTAGGAPSLTSCGPWQNGTGGGVWYQIIGTGDIMIASLCGSSFDTKIRIYTGDCSDLACSDANDDFCGLQSQISFGTDAGMTYYILVEGMGTATGDYELEIQCPPPVPSSYLCYTQTNTPSALEPLGGTSLVLGDDIHSGNIPIGFDFCFNGASYTSLLIASNNYLTFDISKSGLWADWVTRTIPTQTATTGNSVMGPWQDLDPQLGGNILYQTVGVIPFRRFVVSYYEIPLYECPGLKYSSQIVLHETTNCITTMLLEKPICSAWNSGRAVQGLQNGSGTYAMVVPGRNNTTWTANIYGTMFTPTCAPCLAPSSANCVLIYLPLELLYFRGGNNGKENLLEWSTSTEINTHHFVVERSSDGESFIPISSIAAVGNSEQTIEYEMRDIAPLIGVNYYRLQSVDQNGSSTLSEVLAIENTGQEQPIIYPNPGMDNFHIRLPSNYPVPTTLLIRNIYGRVVQTLYVTERGSKLLLNDLAIGIYFLELVSQDAGFTTTKFVVN